MGPKASFSVLEPYTFPRISARSPTIAISSSRIPGELTILYAVEERARATVLGATRAAEVSGATTCTLLRAASRGTALEVKCFNIIFGLCRFLVADVRGRVDER